MKKIKVFSLLLALIMCASVLLTACNDDSEAVELKLADIMNKSWKTEPTDAGIITSFAALDYKGSMSKVEKNFLVTVENDPKEGTFPENSYNKSITRVYNVDTNKELLALNNSSLDERKEVEDDYSYYNEYTYTYVNNYVDVINDKYFAVLSITRVNTNKESIYDRYNSPNFDCYMYDFNNDEPDINDAYVVYTLTIYDATGKTVRTINNDQLAKLCTNDIRNFDSNNQSYGYDENGSYGYYYTYARIYIAMLEKYMPESEGGTTYGDLIVKGSKVFRVVKDGEPTLVKDYGMTKMPSISSLTKSGDFYLERVNSLTYIVYDKDLNKIFSYNMPIYDDSSSAKAYILADGSLLVQYTKQLDQFEEKFDVRIAEDQKFDIFTLIVNKDGETELKDVNYIVNDVKASTKNADGQSYYADTVQNIAMIYPIGEDKSINMGADNLKVVAFSNDFQTMTEIVLEEKIESFPTPITDDYFVATLVSGGKALYDENGVKQAELSSSFSTSTLLAGKYICKDKDAIYDLKGTKVYDLKENSATYTKMGDILFITSIADNGDAKYELFIDGALTEVKGDVIEVSANGYYVVENKTEKDGVKTSTYTYYNAKGDKIGEFESKLSFVASTEDYLLLNGYVKVVDTETGSTKSELKAYKFVITK